MKDPRKILSVSASASISQQKGGKDMLKADAFDTLVVVSQIEESPVAKKPDYNPATIASDILLAVGRHPDLPPLNSALWVLKQTLTNIFDAPVDLATVRWDILDPTGSPAFGAEAGDKGWMRASPVPSLASPGPAEAAPVKPLHALQIGANFPIPFHFALPQPLSYSGSRRREPLPEKKVERGAPPVQSIKLVMDCVAIPSKNFTPRTCALPILAKDTGNRKSPAKVATTRAQKQRQRTPSSFPSGGPSGYKVFPCRWSDCQVKLHNYETLVKHVMHKHKQGVAGEDLNCHWHGCEKRGQISDLNAWDMHAMTHMEQVKKVLGWGPRLRVTDFQPVIHDFLSDRMGNPVTPLAIAAPDGYKFDPPPGYKADAEFRKAHGIPYQRQSEKTKVYNAAITRAEKIGAGIDDVVEPPSGWQGWRTDYIQEVEDSGDDLGE